MRRSAAGLLAGALLLVATSCQDDAPSSDDDHIDYVALGDSYTAAPGVPATDPADPCFRSDSNYPSLIAEERSNVQLTDVSCSGATTDAMTKERSAEIRPQFDALSDDTDLVTIGIGGNDGNVFLTWAQQCQALSVGDPEGSPCADANDTADGDVLLDKVEPLQKAITKVIEGVQDRAPNARVIMVTYPQILPAEGTCPDLVPYAAGDYAYINSIISAQNDAIVAAAKKAGVEWVDVEKASRGHDICAKAAWINGTLTNDWSRGNLLHPFPEEQAAIAQLILEKLSTRRGLVVTVLALLATTAVACDAGDAVPPAVTETIDYVALGDSYTAAPLVPQTDIADDCFRSDGNYPQLVAAELDDARLTDVSCSGADTLAMTEPQVTVRGQTKPPQLDALTAGTDLVTLGIGGNDFGLTGLMLQGCFSLTATGEGPCRPARRTSGGDRLLDLVPRIQDNVVEVIAEIRNRAPDARIVVIDYPQLVPSSGSCPERLPLADADLAYVAEVNRALSGAVVTAAEEAGVESVGVYAASRGHDICADEPWVNGRAMADGAAPLHPFVAEQEAVAELILDLL